MDPSSESEPFESSGSEYQPLGENKLASSSDSSTKFHVPVIRNMVFDYVAHLRPFFIAIPKTDTKQKFSISSYRLFKYTKSSNSVECSESASAFNLTRFTVMKNNANLNLNMLPNCYESALLIKSAKYENVMLLAKEYVGRNEMPFYNSLQSDKPTADDVISEISESDNSD